VTWFLKLHWFFFRPSANALLEERRTSAISRTKSLLVTWFLKLHWFFFLPIKRLHLVARRSRYTWLARARANGLEKGQLQQSRKAYAETIRRITSYKYVHAPIMCKYVQMGVDVGKLHISNKRRDS